MIKLFHYKDRTDLDPAFHNESIYDYYDRSARSDVAKIRQVLNKWFCNYPANEQNELKNRFIKTFSSTFYELFIHELFRSQGFEIILHPVIPNSRKRPDFLLIKNNFEFYLEAKEARDKSHEQEAFENRVNQFYDSINTIKSPNFFLNIEELIIKSKKQPSTKKIIENIEKEVTKYDPDKVAEQTRKFGFEHNPKIIHEDDDLKLIVSFIPKSPSSRTVDEGRPIGIYPFNSYVGGSEESIKNSFFRKAKRYGKLDKPYIICINAIGTKFSGAFDVENAIWGSLALAWSDDPKNRNERWVRNKDGIFFGRKGPIYHNVNGVLVTNVMEFNVPISSYWFAKHPFSEKESNFYVFDLAYHFVENGQIKKKEGKSIGEILKIKSTWLND